MILCNATFSKSHVIPYHISTTHAFQLVFNCPAKSIQSDLPGDDLRQYVICNVCGLQFFSVLRPDPKINRKASL